MSGHTHDDSEVVIMVCDALGIPDHSTPVEIVAAVAALKSMSDPLFRFTGRAVGYDTSGYAHTRWDRAQAVSVLASTKAEAGKKVFAMLGKHWRHGFSWTVKWDSISEELQP